MKAGTHLLLASAALLLAAGFCTYEMWRQRSLEFALAEDSRPLPVVAPPRPAPPPSAQVPIPQAAPVARGELSARAKAIMEAAKRGPGGIPMVRPEALFADLPNVKLAFSQAAAGHQRLGYAQFIRTAGLSPQEEEKFVGILAHREATWGDIRAGATEQGLDLKDRIVDQLDEKNNTATENDLRGLLGPDRYTQLQQYRDTLDARLGLFSLNALVTTSYATDTPFTLEQMNRLAAISTDAAIFDYEKGLKMPGGPQYDKALAEAQKFLTPRQLEVYGFLIDQRQISREMSKIMTDRKK